MRVRFLKRPELEVPELTLEATEKTPVLEHLLAFLEKLDEEAFAAGATERIIGQNGEGFYPIKIADVARFYTEGRNCFAQVIDPVGKTTSHYRIREHIGELEHLLNSKEFIKVNQSEIVQLSFVEYFAPAGPGSIEVVLMDNSRSFVSRRNITQFKRALGL